MESNTDVRALLERELKRVKGGLDEDQVADFVGEITRERDGLKGRQEELALFHRSAQKTVMDADTAAEGVRQVGCGKAAQLGEKAQAVIQEAGDQAEAIRQAAMKECARLAEQSAARSREAEENIARLKLETENEVASLSQDAENRVQEARAVVETVARQAEEKAAGVALEAAQKTRDAADLAVDVGREAEEKAARVVAEGGEAVRQMRSEALARSERLTAEANDAAEAIRRKARVDVLMMIKDAEDRISRVKAEAQCQADTARNDAAARAEVIRQEARNEALRRIEAAKADTVGVRAEVMRRAEMQAQARVEQMRLEVQREAAKVADTARKYVLDQLASIRDQFSSHLARLVGEIEAIGEGRAASEYRSPGAFSASRPADHAGGNGDKNRAGLVADLETDFAALVQSQARAIAAPAEDAREDEAALPEREIEITVSPPVNVAQLIRMRKNLQEVPHLRVVRIDGSWNGGSVITVAMDRPVALGEYLSRMSEVDSAEVLDAEDNTRNDLAGGLALDGGQSVAKNIIVRMKKAPEIDTEP